MNTMNVFKRNKLFNDIAILMNTTDLNMARGAYYAVIKHIVRTVKKEGEIDLPDFGKFEKRSFKARMSNIPNSSERKFVEGINTIRFKPNYKLKDYIKR